MDSKNDILVTGYNGFLGRAVCDELKNGDLGITNLINISRSTGFDLTRESDALTAILSARPSVIVHLAAPARDVDGDGPIFRATLQMGMNVLNAATIVGAKVVMVAPRSVYAPSSAFLGHKSVVEEFLNLGQPADAAGDAKLALISACRRYHASYGLPYNVLVFPVLFGHVLEMDPLISGIKECKGHPEIVLDGMNKEDVMERLFVADAAKAVVKTVLMKIPSGVMNVSSPDLQKCGKVIELIAHHLQYKGLIVYGKDRVQPLIPLCGELSERILGWKPEVSMEAALARILGQPPGKKKVAVS